MKITNKQLKPYVRDDQSRWARKTRWDLVAFGVMAILILSAYLAHITKPVEAKAEPKPNPCVKQADNSIICHWATKDNLLKWQAYLDSEIKQLKDEANLKITAIQTRYSRADSCHNPRGKECLTASGRDTKEGTTVACPKFLKLGTKVVINNHIYVCEDRYSDRLDSLRGLPTFDVFAEADNLKSLPAYKITQVTILK